jgi:hypothetical protein
MTVCCHLQMLEYHENADVARIAGRLVRHHSNVQTCLHRSSLMPTISQAAGKLNDLLGILQVDKWMQLQDRRGRLPQH